MKSKIDELEHQDSAKKKVTQSIDVNSIRNRLDAAIESKNFDKELLIELTKLNIAQINNFKLYDSLKKFIDLKNAESVKVLHAAAGKGNLEFVKYLIENYEINLTAVNIQGNNILHIAALNSQLKIIKYLLEYTNLDPLTVGIGGSNILHIAIYKGNLELIKYLIEHVKVDPILAQMDYDMLYIAIARGHLDVVEYIVDNKICDINNIFHGNNNNLSALLELQTEKFPGVKEKIMEFLLKNNITVLENDYFVLMEINSNKAQTVQFTDKFYARTIDKDYNKSEIDQPLFITRLTNAFLQDGCKEKNINDSKTEYLKLSTELGLPENLIGSVESMFDKFIDDVLCLEASLLSAKTGNCVAPLHILLWPRNI